MTCLFRHLYNIVAVYRRVCVCVYVRARARACVRAYVINIVQIKYIKNGGNEATQIKDNMDNRQCKQDNGDIV